MNAFYLKYIILFLPIGLFAHQINDELVDSSAVAIEKKAKFSPKNNRFIIQSSDFHPSMIEYKYEYLKPNSIYLGCSESSRKSIFINALYLGYNFQLSSQDLLTPYIGRVFINEYSDNTGYTALDKKIRHTLFGLKYERVVSSNFHIGMNFTTAMFSLTIPNKAYIPTFQMGLPLTFCIGKKQQVELSAQPYFVQAVGFGDLKLRKGIKTGLAFRF